MRCADGYRRQSSHGYQCGTRVRSDQSISARLLSSIFDRCKPQLHTLVPEVDDFSGDSETRTSTLEWSSVDDDALKLDPYSLKPLPPPAHYANSDDLLYSDYTLALTGDVFKWMVNNSPLETLQRVSSTVSLRSVLVSNCVTDVCKGANIRADVSRREA